MLAQPKRPIYKAIVFLLGASLAISAIALVVFYTGVFKQSAPATHNTIAHAIIGILLLVVAADIYHRGPTKAKKAKTKKQTGVWPYFLLGIIMMLTNVTTIAMVFAVAVDVRATQASTLVMLGYMAATILSSLLPVLVPLIILAAAGRNSARILNALSGFMKRYAYLITAIFFALLGLFSIFRAFFN